MKPLFILEMANNHMGDVEHGLRIVRTFANVVQDFPDFEFAFKLQYRDLDTFIHPNADKSSKHVKRFLDTRLTDAEFARIKSEMVACGFKTVCTPFDEVSVDKVAAQGFDYLKIASCSLTDWPLLERIAEYDLPIIASTAGASLEDIDRVVSFFEHRGKTLSLLHCVAMYPTDEYTMQLNQVGLLRSRYPRLRIGLSSHEDPGVFRTVAIAIGQGATIFERHVGIENCNSYSSTEVPLRYWLIEAARAFAACGSTDRSEMSLVERLTLNTLRRGVFAAKDIRTGTKLQPEDYSLAFPPRDGQLVANDLSKFRTYTTTKDVEAGAPLMLADIMIYDDQAPIRSILDDVKDVLRRSHVTLPAARTDIELSHHYGIERFRKVGIAVLNYVNREYCKKVLVMLPDQCHPEHYHTRKEETFFVLHGEMRLSLDGDSKLYRAGDMILVGRGVRHAFSTDTGVVFEEISSTHYQDDSHYSDPSIMDNANRKTLVTYWMD